MAVIERTPIRNQVYRHLLDGILAGSLKPGLRIKDGTLAEELDVSRTPVREALIRLSQEGFLTNHPGRGFTVRPLEATELRESYPILWTLEALALSLTGPLPESTLDTLRHVNQRLRREADPSAKLDLDAAWHNALISGCQNRRLLETIAQLRNIVRRYELAYMAESDLVEDSVADHAEIVALLERREKTRAERLLKEHWKRSLEGLASALES